MIEQLQGSISSVIVESAMESALLWLLALVFLRWSRVTAPAIRAVVFSLPLFLPVAVTTTFHVLVPARPSAMPQFKPLEALIDASLAIPLPLVMGFLLAGTAGVGASLVLVWSRKLSTGSQYDVQFSDLAKSYYFGMAVFDNAQVNHAWSPGVYTLKFAPSAAMGPMFPPVIPANHVGRTTCAACHATGVGGAPKLPVAPDHTKVLDALDTCKACHKGP